MSGKLRTAAEIGRPSTEDGSAIWRIARDSGTLDLNSSYAYLLWCRDFADTSAVVRVDDDVVGFVIGFIRPSEQHTLVVWQIAVEESSRGNGFAGRLLDHLVDRLAVRYLETSITADNTASIALFESLAERRGAVVERAELFHAEQFPDDHDTENLYRIGFPAEVGAP
ncbi:MAG: diaminobutyrate acetyltransferase [Actinomycetota bacterium]|nr:diaminobutyrate acetyltransferase [Actinomycetota bacterium]